MTRAEKVAAISRSLAEIRSRVSRIQGEAYGAEQQLDALAAELQQLETESETLP